MKEAKPGINELARLNTIARSNCKKTPDQNTEPRAPRAHHQQDIRLAPSNESPKKQRDQETPTSRAPQRERSLKTALGDLLQLPRRYPIQHRPPSSPRPEMAQFAQSSVYLSAHLRLRLRCQKARSHWPHPLDTARL